LAVLGVSHRGGSGRTTEVDLKVTVAMAPTKDAQKLRRAAERKGKAEDQHQLGGLYYHGREGLKQDRLAAAKWWRKAAAQEHAGAQCNIAYCYEKGEGVEQNHALAATCYKKAAEHGNVRAMGGLGFLYYEGKGVEQTTHWRWRGWRKPRWGMTPFPRSTSAWPTRTACAALPRTCTARRST